MYLDRNIKLGQRVRANGSMGTVIQIPKHRRFAVVEWDMPSRQEAFGKVLHRSHRECIDIQPPKERILDGEVVVERNHYHIPRGPVKYISRKGRPKEPVPVDGTKLLLLRKDRKLSQQQLAQMAGVGKSTVGSIEARYSPNADRHTVEAIAKALGVPMSQIQPTDPT